MICIKTYVVKRGDTLYGISNQFGVSVNDIIKVNNIEDPSNIKISTLLKIPEELGTNPTTIIKYTVKKGDTLYSIAKNYNINIDVIKKENNLKSDSLSIGQILNIPQFIEEEVTLPNYINYTVKTGDTLYKIAKENNISIDTIIKDNNLNSNTLSIGQVLKIRKNNEIEECYGSEYNEEIIYTVKKGDTLYSIAKNYNVSVDEIKNKNNLTSNYLTINQKLKI